MTLTDILEELIMRSAFEKGMNKDYIAQAKSKIEEMFGEWVGSEYPCDTSLDKEDEKVKWYHDGYNQAKQEIRNRVKEGR